MLGLLFDVVVLVLIIELVVGEEAPPLAAVVLTSLAAALVHRLGVAWYDQQGGLLVLVPLALVECVILAVMLRIRLRQAATAVGSFAVVKIVVGTLFLLLSQILW